MDMTELGWKKFSWSYHNWKEQKFFGNVSLKPIFDKLLPHNGDIFIKISFGREKYIMIATKFADKHQKKILTKKSVTNINWDRDRLKYAEKYKKKKQEPKEMSKKIFKSVKILIHKDHNSFK